MDKLKSDDYQFNGIDLVKFICAYLVCMIHNTVFSPEIFSFGSYADMLLKQCFCRIAVPFYFTAAGFLLFKKIDIKCQKSSRLKSYCFKLLRLLGTWIMLSFVGGTAQLWYLSALVVAVIILFMLLKWAGLKFAVFVSIIFYCFGLLGDSYHGLLKPLYSITVLNKFIFVYESVFQNTRNGLFMGLIFVSVGALFAYKKVNIRPLVSFIGLLVSMGILYGEYSLLKMYSEPKGYNMYFSLLPAVFFLFSFATSIKLRNSSIYKTLRVVGMLIFYMQFIVSYVVLQVLEVLKNHMGINLIPIHFFIFTIFVTLLAILIERLSSKKSMTFFRYLYS